MAYKDSGNMVAVALPASITSDKDRTYLMIHAATAVTVTISGGASFAIAANEKWEPRIAPINAIAFTGTGTLVTA